MAHILRKIDNMLGWLDDIEAGREPRNLTQDNKQQESGDKGWPAERVRQTFVDYFVHNYDHMHKVSSPVIPHDDPTLLFANAGMNQFKPIFLGEVDPLSPMASWKRAANSQKCIRAGGKHNDLEDVGKDVYHHTFFEMLGNWSFGNYFKVEAIDMAWELLTKVYGLDPDRIYATYFEGDEKNGVPMDTEARDLWLRYMHPDRVIPFDAKDNFWEMGKTGPCGPCTELHYDRIGNRMVPELVNMDDPDVLEIWNLVFMQFNREPDGSLRRLPAQHVDTGMGFERLTSVLQDKRSNYDTDVFTPIFNAIQDVTGCPEPYRGRVGADDVDNKDMAYRVVADHIRTLSVAITDGAEPGNKGRNSVLRTVLRRMSRYGNEVLRPEQTGEQEKAFLYKLVPTVVESLRYFPELQKRQEHVMRVIEMEELKFYSLLKRGRKKMNKIIAELQSEGNDTIPGAVVYKFWDEFGFPTDLTELMANESGMKADLKEAERLMKKAIEINQAVSKDVGFNCIGQNETAVLKSKNIPRTDSSAQYAEEDIESTIVAIWDGENFVESSDCSCGKKVSIILDQTNFYHESGGQVADIGFIEMGDSNFQISSVQSFGQYVMHIGKVTDGSFSVGSTVSCGVDYSNRHHILPNHTMTHVLNQALREVVGGDVDQQGSVNDSDKLTFDFNSQKLDIDEVRAVEQFCNNQISEGLVVYEAEVPKEAALAIGTIRAMFADKYPPIVRVISIGVPLSDVMESPADSKWMNYSIELCGGTHLTNLKDAGEFRIISEAGPSEGIRRITAVTGYGAKLASQRADELSERIDNCMTLEGTELTQELQSIKGAMDVQIPLLMRRYFDDRIKELDNKDKKQKKAAAKQLMSMALDSLKSQDVGPVVIRKLQVRGDASVMQKVTKAFTKKNKNTVCVFWDNCTDGKNAITFKMAVPKKLSGAINAKDCMLLIKDLIDGGAGGSPTNANAQGKDASQKDQALQIIQNYIQERLS